MLYNQHNFNVSKIADKSGNRPAISGVFITPRATIATDSYKLIEVSVPKVEIKDFPQVMGRSAMRGMKPVIVNAEVLAREVKLPKKSSLPILENAAIAHRDEKRVDFIFGIGDEAAVRSVPVINERFPDYERIFPDDAPRAEIKINAKYLAEVLSLMGKINEQVTIKIYGPDKPVLIEGGTPEQKARGLVMPIKS